MKKKRVYVVPHSHWDREWYFTIEDSNLLLAENMDHLIDLLETNDNYHGYVFDAQMSIVDEYLKVRPENYDRLKQMIEAKRIYVGPWYTQADSLLVHKESLLRNLLYGVKGTEKMGHSMNIGYLPDIFGQNTYLPSLFKGFGIDYAILQRGIYTDQLDGNVNFTWKSPDGESVKANVMPMGYGPGKFLSAEDDFYEEKLIPMLQKLANLNKDTDNLLLPSGGDQVFVRQHFPETIEKLNEKDDEHEYLLSDYEQFMEDTWSENNFPNVIEGELIATERSRIHNTIRSQRYDIKKWNAIVEHKLINQLEPLAVIGQSLGLKYPQARLDEMWKNLFDVHAHDSIGGCNSDDTNEDIMKRLEKIVRQADGLMNLIKRQLTHAISNQSEQDNITVLFNTHAKPYLGTVETVLFTNEKDLQIKNLDGEALDFTITNQEYLSGGKKIVVTAEGDKEVEIPGYYRSEILIESAAIPALGYTTLQVTKGGDVDQLTPENDTIIENDTYKLEVTEGTLILTEKASGTTAADFLQFEDTADAGDSYDYSPLPGDEPIILNQFELISVEKSKHVERMTIEHTKQLPADLDQRLNPSKQKSFTIQTTFEMRRSEDTVRVQHHIDNDVHDHRVRALIQTPVEKPQQSFGDQGYSLIQRPVENPRMANWKENGYKEAPVPIYTVEQFAGVEDKKNHLSIFTKGLKEYEVLKESGKFALTLFRSVGLLGRDDLAWRPGRASGINNKVVTTPDAQMTGKMTFDYAIHMKGGAVEASNLFDLVDRYNERYVTYQNQSLNTFEERLDRFEIPYPIEKLPADYSLAALENKDLFISSIKKAHDDGSVIVRLYNPADNEVTGTITSDQLTDMATTDLSENPLEKVEIITIPAYGYQTIKLRGASR
ncbi:glycoside hydrolase family 38 C-terminal domain-containing protein [Halobacillus salinus]|uniref:Alpha-mannosidase n=1 Tax=Halobacillus salinus TaxID=192814 RepID=A0A4Z0GVP1_9BACI|nr:glycoside hydrolase family 38 C-terminal domain-containing protein [Halobacillus salinus]TGB00755.1 alpha-mannosidase [Halobacillus salinus]